MNSICIFLGIFILTICLKSYLCKEHGDFGTNDVPEQILEWVKELQRLDQEIKDIQSSSPLTINKLKALATSQQRRHICQQKLELLVRHFLQWKAQLVASLLKVNEDDRENFVQAVLQLFENLIKSQNTAYPTTTAAVTATATTTSTTITTIPSSATTILNTLLTTTLNTSSTEDIQTTPPMVVTNSTPDAATTLDTSSTEDIQTTPPMVVTNSTPDAATTLNTSSTEDIQTTPPMVVTNSTPDAATTSASKTELIIDFGNGIDEY